MTIKLVLTSIESTNFTFTNSDRSKEKYVSQGFSGAFYAIAELGYIFGWALLTRPNDIIKEINGKCKYF